MRDTQRRLTRLEAAAGQQSRPGEIYEPIVVDFIDMDGSVAETLMLPILAEGPTGGNDAAHRA